MGAIKSFSHKYSRWFLPVSVVLALAVWQGAIWLGNLPAYILPSPLRVVERFGQELADGTLLYNTAATLVEVILGLLLGSSLATIIGYSLAKSPALERLLSPYLIASQAIPVVAIAPLLVIWFGPYLFSKVLICALIVFFPVLVNTIVGLRAVSQNLRDLMRALDATPAQTLRYLELPAALPVLLAGLRVGATLSVIGAVVGELVGSDRGLGFLVTVARGQFDTTLVFVVVITLITLAMLLYGAVVLVEKRVLKWNA